MANKRQGVRAIQGLVENKANNTVWFAFGEVTEVRTEDRRVRVKILPEELETNWIKILWPLAGQDYGIYVLPEVGTEVGLLFQGAEPDYAIMVGCSNDDDDEHPAANNEFDLIIKPKQGGFIKINNDGIEINSGQKVVVNCDDVWLGEETNLNDAVLTFSKFVQAKYNPDMLAIQTHTNYICVDAALATIGNATTAHAAETTRAK
jgi:uncharacterized protein involved in type VI secretion and phage assembly